MNLAPAESPVVYIIHGNDSLSIQRQLKTLESQIGSDPTIADMNITRLDGRQASEDDLRSAANSMPFLTERRMVILTNPFARCTTDATRKRFLAMLEDLPPSTLLVLVVEDTFEQRKWKSLPDISSNWIRKWLHAAGSRARYQLCALPSMNEMVEWVRKEARSQGGQFQPDAASALVEQIGNDTKLASLEIAKLLTFVDWKRPVDRHDVDELTSPGGQADVFNMVDSIASGNARQAITMLHRLLETQEPLSLFGMITRQFRLLVQARELIDEGHGGKLAEEMHVHPFVADKLAAQARRFSMAQLEAIFHRLLLIDEAIKTSTMPADLALDTFIAEMAR